MNRTAPLFLSLFAACFVGCGPDEADTRVPDGEWKVSVDGAELSSGAVACSDDGYHEEFTYQLFFEGSKVEIAIDGESFATGTRTGCGVEYASLVWLEGEGDSGFRWQITGDATYEGAGGGCGLDEGLDWEGVEILEVVESDDESMPVGCEYEMRVQGTYVGG